MYYSSYTGKSPAQRQKLCNSLDALWDYLRKSMYTVHRVYVRELALFYCIDPKTINAATETEISDFRERSKVPILGNTIIMRMRTNAQGIPWLIHQNILLDMDSSTQAVKLYLVRQDCMKTVFHAAARKIREGYIIHNMRSLVNKALLRDED